MNSLENLAFVANGQYSCFPHDNGDNTFNINSADGERLSYDEVYTFDAAVKVFIPPGYIGHIYTNPEYKSLLTVTEKFLEANKWHNLSFTIKYQGEIPCKMEGCRGLAILRVMRCD